MGRTAGLFALLLGVCVAPSARADLMWDRTNLVTDRGSLLAVAADPEDPKVAWAASESRVWVTDDGGNAWYLVAQVLGERRRQEGATATSTDDEGDEGDEGDEDDEDDEDEFEATTAPIEDLETPTLDRRDSLTVSSATTQGPTPPVVRLRVLNDRVFLTGDRGLWSIDRQARTLGSAVEIRFGRTLAIRDLAQAPWGPILLATSQGLREIDSSGTASPGRGALGERDILGLARSGQSVVAATSEGLWRVDATGATRMGLVGIRRPSDVLALPEGRIAVAASGEVLVARVRDGRVFQRWSLNRVTRLAREPEGRLWAVGVDGAWSWTRANSGEDDAGTWMHRTDGMGDRRLRDVTVPAAASGSRDVHAWVVGRGGAWRRIPERVWISTQRERKTDVAIEDGAPPVWELLEGARQSHRVSREHLSVMRRSGQWAFLLPTVEVEYQYRIRREEDRLDIPGFTESLITQVQVYPRGHHLKVFAMWDVFPVVWALFDADNPYSGPTVAEETVRALATRNQLRNAVIGLYNLWAQRRETWRSSAPPNANAALKSILSLQHIEADLHVLSHGRFVPMTTLETILKGGNP